MSTEPTSKSDRLLDPPVGGPPLLAEIVSRCTTALQVYLRATFDSCDDLFFDLASRAKNSNDQSLYFDSLREIRHSKERVIGETLGRITANFDDLSRPAASRPKGQVRQHARGTDSLQLISNEQAEKDALMTDMVSRARNEYQHELLQLYQRLHAISPLKFELDASPLDPGRITEAFVSASSTIAIDQKVLKLVYKQFERLVLQDLEQLYHDANQILIDAQIMPQLPRLALRNRGAVPRRQRRQPPVDQIIGAGAGTGSAPSSGSAAAIDQTTGATAGAAQSSSLGIMELEPEMRELTNLLRRMRSGGIRLPMFPQIPPAGYGPELSREELVSLISDVQVHPPTGVDGEVKALDIRNAIEAIISNRGNFSLGQTDEDTINVVAMFFDIVLDDRNIPLEIQALVSRLQIPILKVALKDRSFFADRKHPARQLINEIARTSIGWESSSKDAQDALYIKLTEIVEEILRGSKENLAVFEKCLNDLVRFISQTESRSAKIEKRTEERAAAEARTNKARDMVRQILHDRLEGKELPVEISSFLIDEWQPVLQLTYLKHGKESAEWLEAVQTVDDLIWSMQPHTDEKSRMRLQRLLPELNRRMAECLEKTQSHSEEARAKLEVVRDIQRKLTSVDIPHIPLLPLTPVQRELITPQAAAEEKSWKEMTAVERQRVQYETLTYEYLKRVDELPVGTWFLYDDLRRDTTRRCKLSARIAESGVFIFVNRFGVKVQEKPRKAFAYDLQMGHARAIENTPLFERTLESITANLRKLVPEG
jgi:Protein of unknown function (DUF1631)